MIYLILFYWLVAGLAVFILADNAAVKKIGTLNALLICMVLGGVWLPALIVAGMLR